MNDERKVNNSNSEKKRQSHRPEWGKFGSRPAEGIGASKDPVAMYE
jgi:hypothetical protein